MLRNSNSLFPKAFVFQKPLGATLQDRPGSTNECEVDIKVDPPQAITKGILVPIIVVRTSPEQRNENYRLRTHKQEKGGELYE